MATTPQPSSQDKKERYLKNKSTAKKNPQKVNKPKCQTFGHFKWRFNVLVDFLFVEQLYFYQNEDVLLENSKSYCIN